MITKVTGRNIEVTDAIRDHVQSKLVPVVSEYPGVEHLHVVLSVEKFRHIAEVVIRGKQRLHAEAKAETDDMYKSIDAVVEKTKRRLRRARDMVVDHKIPARRERLAEREGKSAPATD